MPITPRPKVKVPLSDTSTPFDVTLTTPAAAEDLVAVPVSKEGRRVSLVNEGPGDVAVAFDGTATVADLLLLVGDAYDEHDLQIAANVSFINVTTGANPRVRGILWSGDSQ